MPSPVPGKLATSSPLISNLPLPSEQDRTVRVVQWFLTSADAVGVPVAMGEWTDVTVEVDGTTNDADYGQLSYGATGVATIEGSNNGVLGTSFQNKLTLSNAAAGAALSGISANKIASIIESPLFIAPRLSTVGTNAKVLVTMKFTRTNPTPR